MDSEQLLKQLIKHEGYEERIYLDSKGKPTFGIGHLIVPGDPEYGKPVETKVSKDRVMSAYKLDIRIAIDSCKKLFGDFDSLPVTAQYVFVDMMFNLGYPNFSGFKKLLAAAKRKDWNAVADEMVDSLWYGQVGHRGVDLVNQMRSIK